MGENLPSPTMYLHFSTAACKDGSMPQWTKWCIHGWVPHLIGVFMPACSPQGPMQQISPSNRCFQYPGESRPSQGMIPPKTQNGQQAHHGHLSVQGCEVTCWRDRLDRCSRSACARVSCCSCACAASACERASVYTSRTAASCTAAGSWWHSEMSI